MSVDVAMFVYLSFFARDHCATLITSWLAAMYSRDLCDLGLVGHFFLTWKRHSDARLTFSIVRIKPAYLIHSWKKRNVSFPFCQMSFKEITFLPQHKCSLFLVVRWKDLCMDFDTSQLINANAKIQVWRHVLFLFPNLRSG